MSLQNSLVQQYDEQEEPARNVGRVDDKGKGVEIWAMRFTARLQPFATK